MGALILYFAMPLILYYTIGYNKMKNVMLKNNIEFTGTMYNLKNLYNLFKALKNKSIINSRERFFLKTMLISFTLSFVLLLIYTILLYFFPDSFFPD